MVDSNYTKKEILVLIIQWKQGEAIVIFEKVPESKISFREENRVGAQVTRLIKETTDGFEGPHCDAHVLYKVNVSWDSILRIDFTLT